MSAELPIPETRDAETDGLSIDYQVFGSGTQDLGMAAHAASGDCGTHALKGVPGEWSLHRARVPAEG